MTTTVTAEADEAAVDARAVARPTAATERITTDAGAASTATHLGAAAGRPCARPGEDKPQQGTDGGASGGGFGALDESTLNVHV